MTVSGLSGYSFLTEMLRLLTLVEDELQTAVRMHAGSRILLCPAIGPLADSYRMHSYTKELGRARSFIERFKA